MSEPPPPDPHGELGPRASETVLGHLLDGIYVYDLAEGHNVFVNRRYTEITGYTLDDLQAMPGPEFAELFHPDERDDVLAHMGEVAASHDGEVFEIDYRFRIADGSWIWCSSRDCVLDRNRDGSARRFIGYFTDVTARKRAQRAVARDQERKDEFLAMLAHELRNPLAPIRSGVEVLQRRGGDPQTRERVLEMIGRQLDHLVHLVDDLMEVSRVTRSTVSLKTTSIDLGDSIRAAVAAVAAHHPEARNDVRTSIPDAPLPIEADRVRIEQVLVNLLDNARKYSPDHGTIWVEARRDGDGVRVAVRDQGIGLDPHEIEEVFELFHQVDRAAGGLGVGLTLARSLVELHGGTLEVRSAGLGKGSEFTITLPLATGEEADSERDGVGQAALRGVRVLVVDDNRDAAESLGMLMDALGAEVCTVFGGREALNELPTFAPDAMLVDIGMPGMNGYEVARAVRNSERDPLPRLVAVTGWGQPEDKERARAAGFDDHLTKPVTIDRIVALLGEPTY